MLSRSWRKQRSRTKRKHAERPSPTRWWCTSHLCSRHHHLVHEGGFAAGLNAQGEIEFKNPTGRLLSARPPQPSAAELARHAEMMLATPRPSTLVRDMTCWGGEKMDYRFALEGLLTSDERAIAREDHERSTG